MYPFQKKKETFIKKKGKFFLPDDGSFYSRQTREELVDSGGLESWEEAFMQGWEEGFDEE